MSQCTIEKANIPQL